MDDDLLWRHLRDLPAFRALLRSVEARFYRELLPLAEPVLDVGCGDGHFASVALRTATGPLTAGIDPAAAVLREAHGRRSYRLLAQALGDALPFADGYFATVVSNSVLEHIPDVEAVLAEISRVLQSPDPTTGRPGGRFIFCVPGDRFTELLFFPRCFRRLRLEGAARAYERLFNRISRHRHCDDPDTWRARLEGAGLQINRWFPYFSARANCALDLGHYLGAPSLVAKKLFGRWILAPTRWNLALTDRLLRPLYREPLPQVGAYLFFVAEKKPAGTLPRL